VYKFGRCGVDPDMKVQLLSSDHAAQRTHVPRDERVFFELVGPAIANEPLHFLCEDREYRFGAGSEPTVVRVADASVFRAMLTDGNLGLGEAYIAKKIDIVHGTLESFLVSLARSEVPKFVRSNPASLLKLAGVHLRNLLRGRYANVQSAYDIGEDLFEACLDPSMAYSCGYQQAETDTLADLQTNKFDRICRKLRIKPGDRLLDIGCGFGGLLFHAAEHYGARCTGITISHHHRRRAEANAKARGLSEQVDIIFASHKTLPGRFEKIVSVGMIEHLTKRDFPVFVANIKRALTEDGLALLHTVGCTTRRNAHDPYIQKYVLPGTRTPTLSEMARCFEKHDLVVQDVENIVRHYGQTLRGWNANFQRNYPRLDHAKYDDSFKRMWEYYLNCCVAGATVSEAAVYQVLCANNHKLFEMPYQRV
jgi:cyclopropane-fatty-acyl-phospholipid synthase